MNPKQYDSDWKFQTYRGSNLAYDMLFETIGPENEDKQGDIINGNCLVNPFVLTTNKEDFSVPKMGTGEGSIDENRRVNNTRKNNFLCLRLIPAIFSVSTEGNN